MKHGISIYGADRADAIKAASKAINRILRSPGEEKTIRTALETFAVVAGDGHTTISNCSVANHEFPSELSDKVGRLVDAVLDEWDTDAPSQTDA